MSNFRTILILLMDNRRLVKGKRFKDLKYVGDPINAIRIFNEKWVDELIIFDIGATKKNYIDFEFLETLAGECFMPLSYGGGIKSINDASKLLNIGFEKIILNTATYENISLLQEIATNFGNQALMVCVDFKMHKKETPKLYRKNKLLQPRIDFFDHIAKCNDLGAGEIIIQAVDREGLRCGVDIETAKEVAWRIKKPIITTGGAGSIEHLQAVKDNGLTAVAASTMFVFHGKHDAVLLTYLNEQEREILEG